MRRRGSGRDERGLGLTLMLFLKVYPGRGGPFFLSMGSLKITSCSKRKTLLSLALDGTPLSCSLTRKVSCWSSFPWAVILPWGGRTRSRQREPPPLFASTKILKKTETPKAHLETLKSAHVHHVVATFGHETHHLHGSLAERLDSKPLGNVGVKSNE